LAAASLRLWPDREAMLPAYRSSRPILPASELSFCATLCPVSSEWRSYSMAAMPTRCLSWAREGRADGIYVVADPLIFSNRARIHTLAMAARLPAIYNSREYVEMGGLMSYGPNFPDMFRRAADMVDKILRGVKPGDLPVQQPTQFDLVINLTTAKALGLAVPPTLLARADEVIE
jgi:ABC-type uncharacterized transport system substrate-binding protein